MAIEAKRDLRIIIPYTVITLALFGALFVEACTWQQFLAGLALLNVPAFFGLKRKDDDDNHDGGVTVPVSDAPGASVQTIGPKRLPAIITPITMMPYRTPARRREKPPPTPAPQPPRSLSAWSMRGALLVGCAALSACAAAHDPRVQAEESYTGEQTKCAATEPSRAAVDACRERARIKWNVPARDGGAR